MPTRATQPAVSKPRPRKPSGLEVLRDLVRQYRQKLAIGQKYYGQADALLDEIRSRLAVNKRLAIGDALYAVLVDRFEDQDKVFQPVAMKRFELQIQDSSGKAVRMRDAKKQRRKAA
jgi:hypothetical protein